MTSGLFSCTSLFKLLVDKLEYKYRRVFFIELVGGLLLHVLARVFQLKGLLMVDLVADLKLIVERCVSCNLQDATVI